MLEVRGRDGALLVRYGVPASKLALEPGCTAAITYCDAELRPVDVATGDVIVGPAPLARNRCSFDGRRRRLARGESAPPARVTHVARHPEPAQRGEGSPNATTRAF
jgi:hypothetical protein